MRSFSEGGEVTKNVWIPRRHEPLHHYYAGHGYTGMRLDGRGSGDSEGLLLDEYWRQENDDIVETFG